MTTGSSNPHPSVDVALHEPGKIIFVLVNIAGIDNITGLNFHCRYSTRNRKK